MYTFETTIGNNAAKVSVDYDWDVDYPLIDCVEFKGVDIFDAIGDRDLESLESECIAHFQKVKDEAEAEAQISRWEAANEWRVAA